MPYVPGQYGTGWAIDVLTVMGITPNARNAISLRLWAQSEGMPPTAFNWLAATDKRPGSRPFNTAGVQIYPTEAVGVEVVASKLTGHLYHPIGDALIHGDALAIWTAINHSPWCAGCQNGRYPNALRTWIDAGQPAVPATPGQAGTQPPQQSGPRPDSWHGQVERVSGWHHQIGVALGGAAHGINGLVR